MPKSSRGGGERWERRWETGSREGRLRQEGPVPGEGLGEPLQLGAGEVSADRKAGAGRARRPTGGTWGEGSKEAGEGSAEHRAGVGMMEGLVKC